MQGLKTGGPGKESSPATLSSQQRTGSYAFGKEEVDFIAQPNSFEAGSCCMSPYRPEIHFVA